MSEQGGFADGVLASAPLAKAELAAHGNGQREVTEATPVEGATLVLHIAPGAGKATVEAAATLRTYRAGQEMMFEEKSPGKWEMTEARLVRTSGQ